MLQDPRGERIFDGWVKPRAMDIICDSLSGQMDSLVRSFSTASSVKALTQHTFANGASKNVSQHQQTRSPKMSFVFFMPV
jgi:hypothetical protein